MKSEWMDATNAAAWRRWHAKSVAFWSEFTDAIIEAARLEPGQQVLDVASGAGDPALALARRIGGSGGVVATDLSPAMLAVARENAAAEGLTNIDFGVADAHTLPFPDATFDRVTCRLGVMYFWDCRRALAEIRRVLKPGGLAAFVAWGPLEENEYMRAALDPFERRRARGAPVPGAPHPYRFSAPGSLSAELRAAEFSDVLEATRRVVMTWSGPPEELWQRLYDVSAATRPYLDSFPAEVRAAAAREATAGFGRYYDGRAIRMGAPIVVASGKR